VRKYVPKAKVTATNARHPINNLSRIDIGGASLLPADLDGHFHFRMDRAADLVGTGFLELRRDNLAGLLETPVFGLIIFVDRHDVVGDVVAIVEVDGTTRRDRDFGLGEAKSFLVDFCVPHIRARR
jgi:hypothetical protein